MKLLDFFGVDLDKYSYETNKVLDFLGLRKQIEKTRQVSDLINAFDKNSIYVDVAKRQQLLLYLKPLLSKEFLPFDKYHEVKDINTATDKDRRYNSEERLLKIILTVVTAKSFNKLVSDEFKPDIVTLRKLNKDAEERYERLKSILSNQTKPIRNQFKNEKINLQPKKDDQSFLGKLFNRK